MKLREATSEDIPEVSELFVSVFSSPPWNEDWKLEWAIDRLSAILETNQSFGLVGILNDRPIAYATGRTLPFKGIKEYEIVEFFVGKEFQGSGIGSTLLKKLRESARDNGVKRIVLMTDRSTPAAEFYKKRGFKNLENMNLWYDDLV